jgi:hypothetical protein
MCGQATSNIEFRSARTDTEIYSLRLQSDRLPVVHRSRRHRVRPWRDSYERYILHAQYFNTSGV